MDAGRLHWDSDEDALSEMNEMIVMKVKGKMKMKRVRRGRGGEDEELQGWRMEK